MGLVHGRRPGVKPHGAACRPVAGDADHAVRHAPHLISESVVQILMTMRRLMTRKEEEVRGRMELLFLSSGRRRRRRRGRGFLGRKRKENKRRGKEDFLLAEDE